MSTKTTIKSHQEDCVSAWRSAIKALLKEKHDA